jgi:hypothetical protein
MEAMKKALYIIAIICVTLACERYPDPSREAIKDYSFNFETNQGVRFFAGEWVSDSIKFTAWNNKSSRLEDSVKVLFEVIKGGGEITVTSDITDSKGYTYTGWKLGIGSLEQVLRASTYDSEGNFINSSDLVAYGFRTDTWDTLTSNLEAGISSMAADTVNKITFMVSNGQLYRQGERYYCWENVNVPGIGSPRYVRIDRNGVFYLTGGNGYLFRSTDHGQTWQECTRPYLEDTYFYYLHVSNDNSLWVSATNQPGRYSIDSGQTWTDAGSEMFSNPYSDVFRLKDGSLLFHGSGCCSLYRSFDEGLTWNKIATLDNSLELYVNDKDEIFLFVHESGITIYKSTDYGATFKSQYSVSPVWISTMENTFMKYGSSYYIFIRGWGILKSADLQHYEIYWTNMYLDDLYIDHNGVLLGTYWNWRENHHQDIVYYRKNSQ